MLLSDSVSTTLQLMAKSENQHKQSTGSKMRFAVVFIGTLLRLSGRRMP